MREVIEIYKDRKIDCAENMCDLLYIIAISINEIKVEFVNFIIKNFSQKDSYHVFNKH